MDKMLKTFNISQTTITIKTKIKIISSAELFFEDNDDGGYKRNGILLKTDGEQEEIRVKQEQEQ